MHVCKSHHRKRESRYQKVIFIIEELFRYTKGNVYAKNSSSTARLLLYGTATFTRCQYFCGMEEKECV